MGGFINSKRVKRRCAKRLYGAWRDASKCIDYNGAAIPEWGATEWGRRAHWLTAGTAVAQAVRGAKEAPPAAELGRIAWAAYRRHVFVGLERSGHECRLPEWDAMDAQCRERWCAGAKAGAERVLEDLAANAAPQEVNGRKHEDEALGPAKPSAHTLKLDRASAADAAAQPPPQRNARQGKSWVYAGPTPDGAPSRAPKRGQANAAPKSGKPILTLKGRK